MSEQTIASGDVEEYVPRDRTGYTITPHNEDRTDAETYYVVTRDADGTGLGAYHTEPQIDDAIDADRAYLASVTPETETDDVAATAAARAAEERVAEREERHAEADRPVPTGDVAE